MTKTNNVTEIIFIHDIVEENGKTIRENNLELKHNIPIDTLVEVKYDTWHGNGCCEKVHARLWIYEHHRDCDGTPLYLLSPHKKEDIDDIKKHMGKYSVHTIGGFSEDSLTPIEVTPKLIFGEGSLKWDG